MCQGFLSVAAQSAALSNLTWPYQLTTNLSRIAQGAILSARCKLVSAPGGNTRAVPVVVCKQRCDAKLRRRSEPRRMLHERSETPASACAPQRRCWHGCCPRGISRKGTPCSQFAAADVTGRRSAVSPLIARLALAPAAGTCASPSGNTYVCRCPPLFGGQQCERRTFAPAPPPAATGLDRKVEVPGARPLAAMRVSSAGQRGTLDSAPLVLHRPYERSC